MSPTTPKAAAHRACDQCHKRKVKCTSTLPCANCSQASLKCTYNAVPQKKGPKGSRAKVISELRETQRQDKAAESLFDFHSSPTSPTFFKRPELLSQPTIDTCVEFFFNSMYPTLPILERQRLLRVVGDLDHSQEAYCLISSMCAFVLIQPGMGMTGNTPEDDPTFQERQRVAESLIVDVIQVRKRYDYIESPSTDAIVISFFLFGCFFSLDKHTLAWYFLREATTLAHNVGMEEETAYFTDDTLENALRRKLFWLLFVTERAYALQRRKPLALHATIELPVVEETDHAIAGFLYLIELFRPFDDTFVGLWNKSRNDCTTSLLTQMQKQLQEALPPDMPVTTSQEADLRTTQHWLRTMIWQLAITNGFLSSTSPDPSMTFSYPIIIARDLLLDTNRLTLEAMEVHGIGLIEKLFDMACTLADVIQCVLPLEANSFDLQPAEYLNRFLALLASLRGGRSRFVPLLLAKVAETLPSMPMPILPIDSHVKPEPETNFLDTTTVAVIDPFSPTSDPTLNPTFANQTLATQIPEVAPIPFQVFPSS